MVHTDGRCGGQRAAVASNLPPCPAPHLLSGPFQPSKLDRVLLYSVLSPRSAAQVGSSSHRLCRRTSLPAAAATVLPAPASVVSSRCLYRWASSILAQAAPHTPAGRQGGRRRGREAGGLIVGGPCRSSNAVIFESHHCLDGRQTGSRALRRRPRPGAVGVKGAGVRAP